MQFDLYDDDLTRCDTVARAWPVSSASDLIQRVREHWPEPPQTPRRASVSLLHIVSTLDARTLADQVERWAQTKTAPAWGGWSQRVVRDVLLTHKKRIDSDSNQAVNVERRVCPDDEVLNRQVACLALLVVAGAPVHLEDLRVSMVHPNPALLAWLLNASAWSSIDREQGNLLVSEMLAWNGEHARPKLEVLKQRGWTWDALRCHQEGAVWLRRALVNENVASDTAHWLLDQGCEPVRDTSQSSCLMKAVIRDDLILTQRFLAKDPATWRHEVVDIMKRVIKNNMGALCDVLLDHDVVVQHVESASEDGSIPLMSMLFEYAILEKSAEVVRSMIDHHWHKTQHRQGMSWSDVGRRYAKYDHSDQEVSQQILDALQSAEREVLWQALPHTEGLTLTSTDRRDRPRL